MVLMAIGTVLVICAPEAANALAPSTDLPSIKIARVVHQGERTLVITDKAEEKIKEFDRIVRNAKNIEINASGLTQEIGSNITILIDVILPRENHVFFISDDLLQPPPISLGSPAPFGDLDLLRRAAEFSKLREVLIHAVQLTLDIDENNEMCFRELGTRTLYEKNPRAYNIDSYHPLEKPQQWDDVYSLVFLLNPRVERDIERMKTKIRESGPIQLLCDWDFVSSETLSSQTASYLARVKKEAARQRAKVNFDVHSHPRMVGLDIVYYSHRDLIAMHKENITWFEIRALGSESDPSDDTSVRVATYNLDEEKKLIQPVIELIKRVRVEDPGGDNPETTYLFVQELVPVLLELAKTRHIQAIMTYVFQEYPELGEGLRSIILDVCEYLPNDTALQVLKSMTIEILERNLSLEQYVEISQKLIDSSL